MRTFASALPALLAEVAAEHEETLSDLRCLVEMETPSTDLPSLHRCADHLHSWLDRQIGPLDRVDRIDHEVHGPTLVAEIRGDLPGRVLIVGHYDTVWPLGTLESIPFTVTDGIIRGPGVLDMKAGLVTGVHAVRLARRTGLALPTITFVLNGDEELGSRSSRPIIEREAAGAIAGFVLEPGVGWDLKTERKGVGVFTIGTTGIESHAGNDPKGGASAVVALSELILQVAQGTDLEAGTSVNVGIIRGGSARNVIAGTAEAEVDVRVTTRSEAERIHRLLTTLTASDPRVSVSVTGGWNRPPMQLTAGSHALVDRVQAVAALVRSELGLRSVGGGSDGNFLAALGLPVLDGLGASGNGPHARDEHVMESDIDDRIVLFAGILAEACAPKALTSDTDAPEPMTTTARETAAV
ncbi:M20 family metallopeptidase [Brevibacterium casei]|uniref:Carboxypeptidase G2 n=1 Tax=Brevibacterium casei S18 TaxID=1229781 RepID=K9AS19_9MICO|nr:M20 family metallopeptidase [Brevibacterium casei]EKU48826.1 carboxypeptidase G2 [Brevibacterium casei S18]